MNLFPTVDAPRFQMRTPCKCGEAFGFIRTANGQDVVRCAACETYQYNAPKTETGRAVRTVVTVHNGISAKTRARIIERANDRCEVCGKLAEYCELGLQVGHCISVADGMRMGLTDQEINQGERTLSLRQMALIVRARGGRL